LLKLVEEKRASGDNMDWQETVVLADTAGRRILMCRSAALPTDDGRSSGQVLVFDDITEQIRSQRDAAWGEVARRLAHEIKNPLTPIQLSAERLRHKFMSTMNDKDVDVMDRATRTIVQQVEAMKKMVNAFSDYARAPALQLEAVDFYELVRDVAALYHGSKITIRCTLQKPAPVVNGDAGRLRQLLHNLFKNALEAARETDNAELQISSRWGEGDGDRLIHLSFEDNGPGFADDLLESLFEPYVTTKVRGTGLGLAIVKKIVEEHNGQIRAYNTAAHHACVELSFRAKQQSTVS
jgi:nitrogen fixation/metabolism regulation signal transduction histidine kinase